MICPVCRSPRPTNLWTTGLWYELDGITPRAIAYRCPCGNNRHIPWDEATEGEREQGTLAQQSRDAASEVMGRES